MGSLLNRPKDSLHSLDGLRVLANFAIVQCHAFVFFSIVWPLKEFIGVMNDSIYINRFVRGPVTYGVDTFFVLSGFLLILSMYRDSSFPDNYSFGKRVVHRWFRLFPLVFLLSAVFWGMESPANKAVAWATLAGVSNFLPSMNPENHRMYFGVAWSDGADFQAGIVLALLLPFLARRKKLNFWVLAAIFIANTLLRLVLAFVFYPDNTCPHLQMPHFALWSTPAGVTDLKAQGMNFTWSYSEPLVQECWRQCIWQMAHLYMPTYTRLLAFVAGATAGVLYQKAKTSAAASGKPQQPASTQSKALFFITATLCTLFVFNLVPFWDSPNMTVRRIFLGLFRPIFCASLACVLYFLTAPGTESIPLVAPLKKFLSLPVWYPFSVLSHAVYLIHNIPIAIYGSMNPISIEALAANPSKIFWISLGLYLVASVIAIPLHFLVEKPCMKLGVKLTTGSDKQDSAPAAVNTKPATSGKKLQ